MSTQEITGILIEMNKIRLKKAELVEEEDLLWKRFFEIADDVMGQQESYKFTDLELGLSIAREMHSVAPRLDIDGLSNQLTDEQWELISVPQRVFDIDKLEVALATGQVTKSIVEQYTERPVPIPHKKFTKVTKLPEV